jgi:hypothetical protein
VARRIEARYSLAELLSAQRGPIKRHPDFSRLERLLRESPALRRVRLPRVAYVLLNEPRLDIRHISDFRSTYRVPESPFLSIFLKIKWERRAVLAANRTRREAENRAIIDGCPVEVLALIRFLEEAERSRNADRPVWKKRLFPATKRRALQMAEFSWAEWLEFLIDYIGTLRGSYRRIALPNTEALIACMILECLPDPATGRLPASGSIKASYRMLSKIHHPDAGGNEERFLLLKQARDTLLAALDGGGAGEGRARRGR